MKKYQQMNGYCQNCGVVTINQRVPNHLLHLLLTLFTFGWWALVWIVLLCTNKPWHCTRCGRIVLN